MKPNHGAVEESGLTLSLNCSLIKWMGLNRRRLFSKGKQSSERSIFSRELENQKGAVHLFLPLLVLAAVVIVSANIPTTKKYDSPVQGVYIARPGNGNDNSNPGKPETATSSNQSSNQGERSEETKVKQETKTTGGQQTKIELKGNETKRNLEGKIQQKGNSLVIQAEIKTASEEATSATLEDLRSVSKFPLRIDTTTNQLIMTKNGVERVLTVLPAKAVQNMLKAHLKKGLGPKFFAGATPSASAIATASATPSSTESASPTPDASATATPTEEPIATDSADIIVLSEQISLEENDEQFVYKIPAKKNLKVFGLIPVTTNLTGYVSAETGALIKEQESLLAKILDFLSP